MAESVVVPGSRDVRASLDTGAADRCVVACPPHPQFGGSRSDRRLTAVAEALADRKIACLRFDYGPWDHGNGELDDATNAVACATERFDRVGIFGYSFGAMIAILAAARDGVGCVSALAPDRRLGNDLDPIAALDSIAVPVQVIYGERDTTVDWQPVVDHAIELGLTVTGVPADHHFVGQHGKVAELVAAFVVDHLAAE